MNDQPLFSSEMLATADALRQIRTRLSHLIAKDMLPSTIDQRAVSDVLCQGLDLAQALEKLARD